LIQSTSNISKRSKRHVTSRHPTINKKIEYWQASKQIKCIEIAIIYL